MQCIRKEIGYYESIEARAVTHYLYVTAFGILLLNQCHPCCKEFFSQSCTNEVYAAG